MAAISAASGGRTSVATSRVFNMVRS
jgi:hypothetical protein